MLKLVSAVVDTAETGGETTLQSRASDPAHQDETSGTAQGSMGASLHPGPSEHVLPVSVRAPRRPPPPPPAASDVSNTGTTPDGNTVAAAAKSSKQSTGGGRVATTRLADKFERKASEKSAFEELLLHTDPNISNAEAGRKWQAATMEEKQRAKKFQKNRPAVRCAPGTLNCACLSGSVQ
ncbi:unnamed protein product [Peniophora sp. CBMAI 1063]|nr:unnamed protein product [Peniophora sp. CBMAI 1063]